MEFRILGPLEARGQQGAVPLGGTKPRAVLAMLLLHANEPVSAERLAVALWGEDAPPGAVKTVQVHVSRLRKALGNGDLVATTPAGYRLTVAADELDSQRFERLLGAGQDALEAGKAEQAAELLREALALWRGPPLAEFMGEPFAPSEIARLEEERLSAIEVRIEADLARGRHAALVPELQQLVAEHPTRERLVGQLMLALYRCGRQADALRAYRAARHKLVDELGLEPGPEIRALHEAVLNHESWLELRHEPPQLPAELDASAEGPLVGRTDELARLAEQWRRARRAGRLLGIVGPAGIGKTRLAAELASDVHRLGGVVLHVSAAAPAEATVATVRRALAATQPTLVVIDDLDGAPPAAAQGVSELAAGIADVPVLALALADGDAGLEALQAAGAVALEPLDDDAIREIARSYAPRRPPEEIPVQRLAEVTGGVPALVHAEADRWARREAARRIELVARRAAAGRDELRAIESELVGDVAELQTAAARPRRIAADALVVCPFKGLASYDAADAPYFFGREQLVAEIVARLVGAGLLGVVGPSGSGKSSLVRAGLLPALANGVLPGSERWEQVVLRPGEHPLRRLTEALGAVQAGAHAVVAVDQFEEAFVACRDEEERTAFVDELLALAHDGATATVVLALRADFYGRCAAHAGLARVLGDHTVLVGEMADGELRRAIELPARRAGLRVEPALADRLVADLEGEPGALPLLSTALLELWQRRDGRTITLAAYAETGGVRGAVARLAEAAYERLDAGGQRLARGIFLRVTADDDGVPIRRRVACSELASGTGPVLDVLVDGRLLTRHADTVEVAHEALLREWPRLRGWLDEDQQGRRLHRHLAAAAQEWRAGDRDPGELYRSTRLAAALEWRREHEPDLNDTERAFLDASATRRDRERAARRRGVRLAFGGLTAVLAVIAAVAILALQQSRQAARERDIAISRGIAATADGSLNSDPSLGLSLALRAVAVSPTEQAVGVLRQATLGVRALQVIPVSRKWVQGVRISPDGRRALTADQEGRVVAWDLAGRAKPVVLRAGGKQVFTAAYSRDGRAVAATSEDGTVAVTDATRPAWRTVMRVHQVPFSVAFNADATEVAASFDDGTVRIARVDGTGTPRVLRGHAGPVFDVEYSPDGRRLLSAGIDGTLRLWDPVAGTATRVIAAHRDGSPSATFSPDGRRIVSAGYDATIKVWDTATGARLRTFPARFEPFTARFTPDGRQIVTGGRDGSVRILDASDPSVPALVVLRGHRGGVLDVGVTPDGRRIVSGGQDGTLRVWDPGTPVVLKTAAEDATFTADGRHVVTSGRDGDVRVFDAAGGPPQRVLAGGRSAAAAVAVSANGRWVASGDATGTIRLWRAGTRAAPRLLHLHNRPVSGLAFDARATRLASSADDGRVVLWSLPSGRPVVLSRRADSAFDVAFAPDGRDVVVAGEGGYLAVIGTGGRHAATLLRGETPFARSRVPHRGAVLSATFSPDGRTIASAGADGTTRLWRRDGEPLTTLRGHEGQVESVGFRRDGERLVTTGLDGTVRVWDPAQPEALAILRALGRRSVVAQFSPDGRRVLATVLDDAVWIMPCEVCGSLHDVLALARARAARQLTADERRRFLAGAP